MSRKMIKRAITLGLEGLLKNPYADRQKIQLYLDNIDFVTDFSMRHRRQPTPEEIIGISRRLKK